MYQEKKEQVQNHQKKKTPFQVLFFYFINSFPDLDFVFFPLGYELVQIRSF
jgi:hypothetical protein